MKNNIQFLTLAVALVAGLTNALAQTTAFNYQGRLAENGIPVTEKNYDMIFGVFDAASGGGQVGADNTQVVGVTNGLFSVTLNFGPSIFTGPDRWLQIQLRPSGSPAPHTTLSPRQPLLPTPYAIYAATVGVLANDSVTSASITDGTITAGDLAPGIGVWTKVGADIYYQGGRVGIGTSNPNRPLTVDSSGIGGYGIEHTDGTRRLATYLDASGGWLGTVSSDPLHFYVQNGPPSMTVATSGQVGIGTRNPDPAAKLDVVGTVKAGALLGMDNQPLELRVNNARGLRLEPNATSPNVISGHADNSVLAGVGGATIGGGGAAGSANLVSANNGTVGGGQGNTVSGSESVIGGGSGNSIQAGAFLSTIGGGDANMIQTADRSTIAGGYSNVIGDQAFRSFIGGGSDHRVSTRADGSAIGGGYANVIGTDAYRSFVGGGSDNRADSPWTTISGGAGNVVEANATHATVAGGERNRIGSSADHASVSGGDDNVIQTGAGRAVIGGGSGNRIGSAAFVTINGGAGNEVLNTAHYASIGGGDHNRVTANADRASIGGGRDNVSAAAYATVGGGAENAASGDSATVPGGRQNVAGGQYSFGAGQRAKAMHDGSFVWADSQNADFASGALNEFAIRAAGGVRLETAGAGLTLDGTRVVNGSGTPNYLPLFTGNGTLGNSGIFQSGGRVGIGTTTPNFSSLHVKSFVNDQAIRIEGTGANGSGGQIVFGTAQGNTYVSEAEDDAIYLVAPLGVGLGPGNVGIGVSSLAQASHKLTVVSSPQNDDVLRLIGRSGTYKYGAKLSFGDGDYAFVQEDFDDWLQIYADKGTRILGGNVGIGTSDPQQRLHVNGVARFDVGGGSINITTPGGWPGVIAYSPAGNRRDVQFYDDSMVITTSSTGSPSSPNNGIAIHNNGNVGIGTTAPAAKLDVAGQTRTCTLQITGGCDLSEPFPMSSTNIPKGSVVIIDEEQPGRLRLSDRPYDTRVAGIISGANGVNPGISLSQEGLFDCGQDVALSGRVYVLADASIAPVKPGDLLTTADTPGHAMKVTDHAKAQGAIIGKAMSSLKEGTGLVLVLVTLQ